MVLFGKHQVKTAKNEEGAANSPAFTNLYNCWHTTSQSAKRQSTYVRQLEQEFERLQCCYFNLSTELARLQFWIRQIIKSTPCNRNRLIRDLETAVFKKATENRYPTLKEQDKELGSIKKKQHMLIKKLKDEVGSFETATGILVKRASEAERAELDSLTKAEANEQPESKKVLKEQKLIELYKAEQLPQGSKKSKLLIFKQRKSGGSETSFCTEARASNETCCSSGQSSISARSSSFKELVEFYQSLFTK